MTSIPPTLVDAVAAGTQGDSVVECARLYGGIENEAWAVTTSSVARLVVRIAPDEAEHFGGECWAIERARRSGVPGPEVLWTKGHVSVQRRVAGVPLASVTARPGEPEAQVVRRAGALLARIHTIETHGYGALDAAGRARFPSWDAYVLSEAEKWAVRLSSHQHEDGGVLRRSVDRAVEELRANRDVLADAESRLLHGDPKPDHIFVDASLQITGIIDFGDVRAGDAVFDVAWWSVLHEPTWPSTWLTEGYPQWQRLPNVALRLRLHRLFIAAVLGSFGVEAQIPHLCERAAATFDEHLT